MDSTIIVAILSLLGTVIGSLGGVLAANNLIKYRIQKLEEKVNKHNNLIDRMYKLERDEKLVENEIVDIKDDIKDLKSYHK